MKRYQELSDVEGEGEGERTLVMRASVVASKQKRARSDSSARRVSTRATHTAALFSAISAALSTCGTCGKTCGT